jgi:hypothetical protein
MWDVRRVFILGTSIVLLCGFLFEMFGSHPSWAAIVPNGEITHSGPFIFERYELTIQNGKPHDATFSLSTSGIDHLAMVAPKRIISVSRNSRRTFRLTLEAPINQLSGGQRYPVNIFVQSLDGSTERPKPKGLAAAVWAYIIFTTVFITMLTSGVIYLCTHAPKEDDSTPSVAGKLVPPSENGG